MVINLNGLYLQSRKRAQDIADIAQSVEQLFCKQQVGGSNPSIGSNILGRYQSGQMGQTVNLLAHAYGGSNPSLPTYINQAEML